MAIAGQIQVGVDQTFLSNSVAKALIQGTNMARRGGALTPAINEQAFRQPLGRITGDINRFESSLAAANQRVIAFGASATVFYGISTAIKGLVTSTIQVNKSMVEINSIFGLSTGNLNKFKTELFDVARKTGQSFNVVAESAKEFSRQGLTVEDTLKRVRDSMILTRLTGLSAADAANTLTAAMNSFSKAGLDSTEILNKMVAVDSAFAVSSKDLADALTRVGSAAQDSGVSFEQLLSLVASVKQTTGRDGAVIGNAFKTIFNRSERSTTIKMLEDLGIATRDAQSNILPMMDLMKNLAKQFDQLGVSQKQQVSQLLGGVFQTNTLKALMADLSKENSIYEQGLRQIGKAQDEAIKRNEYLNKSLEVTLKNAVTSFSQIGSNIGEKVIGSNVTGIQGLIKDVFGKENFENLLGGLEGNVDAKGVGATIGKGLIDGIGNVFGVNSGIPGPGLLGIGLALTKAITMSVGMAFKDIRSMMNFFNKSEKVNIGIEKAILGANDAEKMRLATAKTLAEQEKVILDILIRQNEAMARMAAERNALRVDVVSNNPKLAKQAINFAKTTPTGASGILPAMMEESHAISRGVGGATPSAKPVVIPNFNFGGGKVGPVVANTDEYLVPNFYGKGSAIFNKNMVSNSGLPSGAVKIAAGGLTPEFSINKPYGNISAKRYSANSVYIDNIGTNIKGKSGELYQELFELLRNSGINLVHGEFLAQDHPYKLKDKNIPLKSVYPQLIRGRFGRGSELSFIRNDDDSLYRNIAASVMFGGGKQFDEDLLNNDSRIRRLLLDDSLSLNRFSTYLADGHIPKLQLPLFHGINAFRRTSPTIGNLYSRIKKIEDQAEASFSTVPLGRGGIISLADINKIFLDDVWSEANDSGERFATRGEDSLFASDDRITINSINKARKKYEDELNISGRYPFADHTEIFGKSSSIIGGWGVKNSRTSNFLKKFTKLRGLKFTEIDDPRSISYRDSEGILNNTLDHYLNNIGNSNFSQKLNIPSFSSSYIPNFARRGVPTIKGRQIRFDGQMDLRSARFPDALVELYSLFGFGLEDEFEQHPHRSTVDRKVLEKFGISIPPGLQPGGKFPYRGAEGIIPNFANKFYRGITPSINKFNGKPLSPFDFSDTKGSLFASRDFGEAMSYADQQHKFVGEFSLKKGLKGLNLFSKSGRDKLAEIIEKNLDKDDFFTSRMSPDKSKYEEVDVPVSQILRNMKRDPNYSKSYFNKDDVRDIFRTLDRRSINNLLRSLNYDFVTFPDISGEGRQVNRNISILTESAIENKKWKNAYTQEQISKLSDPYTIASGYVPNFARRGRPSIKGRQIRYEGPMDFRTQNRPDALMELFTLFGFGLGNHPSISTVDQRVLEEFGIKIPSGLKPGDKFPYRGANGIIPESLNKAISREIKAGAPLNSIYLDKDSRLVSKDNPMGLLVANRRDEPAGGFEGVNRYQKIGLNPKLAGASHIPNFADPSELLLKYLTKSGEATPILGNITYPGSTASMGDAQKSIEKYLNSLVKNINIKNIDFTSSDFQKQIQNKVKELITSSFKGIDFGRTSAFSKITDDIIVSREKEIKSLVKYQFTVKENQITSEKRQKFEDDIIKNIRGGSVYSVSRNEWLRQATDRSTTTDIEYSGSRLATKIPFDLMLTETDKFALQLKDSKKKLKDIVNQNIANIKLEEGVKFSKLTKSERGIVVSQLQNAAISKYGFGESGLSRQEIMQNQQARMLITDFVKNELAKVNTTRSIDIPKPSRLSMWNNRLMNSQLGYAAMMFGPSMLSGFVPEGKGGTLGGRSLGAAGGFLQGAGTGAMIGSFAGQPIIGAAIGGVVGSFTGALSKWEKSFEEIGKEIDEVNGKNQKTLNNIQQYVLQTESISEMFARGASGKDINKAYDKQLKLYSSIEDPNVRKELLAGRFDVAGKLATEKANRDALAGNVVSSAASGVEDVSGPARTTRKFLQWYNNNQVKGNLITAGIPGASGIIKGINDIWGSPQGNKYFGTSGLLGGVSDKNLTNFATALRESTYDQFNQSDLSNFKSILGGDISKGGGAKAALDTFASKMNLTEEQIKVINLKLDPEELGKALNIYADQMEKHIKNVEEVRPILKQINERFQLSSLHWKRIGLEAELETQRFSIRGQTGIENYSNIRGTELDLNYNLSDISRADLSGKLQMGSLKAQNQLNLQVAASEAARSVISVMENDPKIESKDLENIVSLIRSVGTTGNTDQLLKELNEYNKKEESAIKEGGGIKEMSTSLKNLLSVVEGQIVVKLDGVVENGKAQISKQEISNQLNVIRAKEAQRQNFLNNANFSVGTFEQLRQAGERAGGQSFLPGKYARGNRLQAILNEGDIYSNLGIAQTDDSLSYYNNIRQRRAGATMQRVLSQKLGREVGSDQESLRMASIELQNSASLASDRQLGGRFTKTLELSGFDAQKELLNLRKGSGSTDEYFQKLMQTTQSDPIQGLIAKNTTDIADVSSTISSDMVSGFDKLFMAINAASEKNKMAMEYNDAAMAVVENQQKLRKLEDDAKKGIDISKEKETTTLALKQSEINFEKLKNRPQNIAVQNTAPIVSSEQIEVNKPFEVTDTFAEDTAKKTDTLGNSMNLFVERLKQVNSEWDTFGDLAVKSADIVSNSFGQAFGDFVTGSMRGKDAFKAFAASILSDIARLYAQKAMTGLIAGALGLFDSGPPGGGIATSGASTGAMSTNIMSTANTGGSILKFATGGKVPALLTGGEFYFSPSAARSIGQNNLNAINSGTARFAGGGLVRGGSGYMDDVPAMLDNGGFVVKRSAVQKYGSNNLAAMARNLGGEVRMYASGGNVSPAMGVGGSSSGSGGNTNVKIELHDNRTSASASSDASVNDPEFNKRLSMAIKSSVLNTINEQRRIGGSLRQIK